MYVNVMRGD